MDTVTTCSCGRKHSAAAFRNLPLCGHQDDGDGGELELRNCACGSTISRDVPVAGPALEPSALAIALLAAFNELPGPALPLRPLAKAQTCMPLGAYRLEGERGVSANAPIKLTAAQRRAVRSLMVDGGDSRAEAVAWVLAMGCAS